MCLGTKLWQRLTQEIPIGSQTTAWWLGDPRILQKNTSKPPFFCRVQWFLGELFLMMIVRAASGGETFHRLELLHGPWSCRCLFRLLYPNWRESCPTSQNVYPVEANVCCLGFVLMDLWCQARKPIGSYQVLPHFVPVLRTIPPEKSWIVHILWWASSELGTWRNTLPEANSSHLAGIPGPQKESSSSKVGEDEEESNLTNAAKKLLGPLGRVTLGMVKVGCFCFFLNKVWPVEKEFPWFYKLMNYVYMI